MSQNSDKKDGRGWAGDRPDRFEVREVGPEAHHRFKNDEIKIDELELLEVLEGTGKCPAEHGFLVTPAAGPAHPLLDAIKTLQARPATPLNSIKDVLAKFLLELSLKARPEVYGACSVLTQALYDCLEAYGSHFLLKLEHQNKRLGKILSDKARADSFCAQEEPGFICIVFDFFVRVFLRAYLQTDDFAVDFVLRFLKFLGDWLVRFNLSRVEVRFNSAI